MSNVNEISKVPLIGKVILPQAEYESFLNLEGEFDVVCYQVVTKIKGCSSYPISPLFATKEQALACLSEVRKTDPLVRISKQVYFYTSKDDDGRIELLNSVLKAGGN